MEKNTQRVQEILNWRESLTLMNDNHFLELIRMYLGEIKTPYNKQKLLEDLSSFLRKNENIQNILKLLSFNDILILSAIKFLTHPTQEKLSHFFATDFTFADLYERLLNLEERLLIYRKIENKKVFFAITPQLRSPLEPFLSLNILLPNFTEEMAKKNNNLRTETCTILTKSTFPEPNSVLIASIFSFFFHEDELCKADGSFKKRCITLLNAVFPFTLQKKGFDFFMTLFTGLKNLGLFRQNATEISCKILRWENFCKLDDFTQLCYIVAASCGAFSNAVLQSNANLIMTILFQIPKGGFSKAVLTRCVALNKENECENSEIVFKKSRLAELLQENTKNEANDSETEISANQIVENLIKSGVLIEENNAFFCSSLVENYKTAFLQNNFNKTEKQNFSINKNATNSICKTGSENSQNSISEKVDLTINADFSACILNTPTLSSIFPLMRFLKIESFDSVPQFEISKKSCIHAFDSGFDFLQIMEKIEKYSSHKISQNLQFSISEWFKNYNSAFLYHGYVLKVASEKKVFIENNEKIKPFINAVLGEGIYLLDFFDDEEAKKTISESGLDFIGAIKTVINDTAGKSFCHLSPKIEKIGGTGSENESGNAENAEKRCENKSEPQNIQNICSKEERDEILNNFLSLIENSSLSAEQKDGLSLRVKRKIIINANQLRAESLRFERVEASGMDYSGKVHVIESAISNGNLIELVYDANAKNTLSAFVGEPLNLEKTNGDAIIHLRLVPSGEEKSFSLSKANLIKRIRGSIFKNGE